ncbi:MAG: enoyl-CoA hydratase-related protein [Pseudomonadota bacterium]
MQFKNIIVEKDGSTCTITINRPEVRNALNLETVGEIGAAVKQAGGDKGARAVIITGSGEKAFVSGADIAAMRDMKEAEAKRFAEAGHACMRAIESCPKPVIAAVNGFALGGGTELTIACDIAFAADTARFGLPEVKLGLYPGFGGTQRLPRLIGSMRARELIFTGRIIDAREALEWGIVSRVVPQAELMPEARKLAAEIAGNGPVAIAAAKSLVVRGMNLGLESALDNERIEFARLFTTADRIEGLTAFLEKRKPNF